MCNGVAACEEVNQRCSADTNQCAGSDICDASTDTCVSTCAGCLVDRVCVANGIELAGNPCSVCDTAQSTTAYSPAVGRECGSAASACSAQDTCGIAGVCQVNHALLGTACGNAGASACNNPDTCDGNGSCRANVIANDSACDDGLFCTVGDECQGGTCTALPLDCGTNRTCDESANVCRCAGCTVGGACIAPSGGNAGNVCQVCDPTRSTTNFSPRLAGAFCDEGQQCNAAGQCISTGTGTLSAGTWDTCVLEAGAVRCLAAGSPVNLGDGARVLQVTTGAHHSCALLEAGSVRCWADSLGRSSGQLGTTNVQAGERGVSFGTVELGGRAVSISAGTNYSCAVMDTGAVRCWGQNILGQLGYGHTETIGDDADELPLGDVDLGGVRAIQVDAGNNHTCAVLEGGGVRCWGRGFGGALGYGNVADVLAPPSSNVDVGGAVVQVAAGSAHTCAVLATGALRCWGSNAVGELGYGHTQTVGDDETPGQAVTRTAVLSSGVTRPLGGNVATGGTVLQVQIAQGAQGAGKTCVRLTLGAVRCWGNGAVGGLGYLHQNNIGDDETPVEAETIIARRAADGSSIPTGGNLALGGAAITVADGGDQCALRGDFQVICWRGTATLPVAIDL